MTDSQPKCYATVGDKRILGWKLEAEAVDPANRRRHAQHQR